MKLSQVTVRQYLSIAKNLLQNQGQFAINAKTAQRAEELASRVDARIA